jgi:hypothetical protein
MPALSRLLGDIVATMFRPRASFPATCIALLLALSAGACVRVQPYERETLARRDMELGRNAAMTAGEDHGRAYREGSSGGGDAKGGGCGCN